MPSAKSRQQVDAVISEQQIQQIRQFDGFFSTFRLFGLTERPSVIVGDKVSRWFKLYSFILAVASVAFAVRNLISVIYPELTHMPRLNGISTTTQRTVYPIWSVMCAAIRVCLSYTTLSRKFGRFVRKCIVDLYGDHRLMERVILMTKRPFLFNLILGTVINVLASSSVTMYQKFHDEPLLKQLRDPYHALFMVEATVLTAAWVGSYSLMGIIGYGLLRYLFNGVSTDLIRAFHLKNEDALQAAIERHTICWRLTNAFDHAFRVVIGFTFTLSVPIFSIVTTQIIDMMMDGLTSQEIEILIYLLLWSGSCIFFTSLTCAIATSVCEAAGAPLRPLLEAQPTESVAVTRFIQRLISCPIGFTYFNFFVVQRTTILSVFSLMISYLIIFLQMLQATPSANSSFYNNETNSSNS